MKTLSISTSRRSEFVDITSQVQKAVSESKVKNGLCIVYCPHTTAGFTINENADPSVTRDILDHLEGLVPEGKRYYHAEGNSDAHIKASLMGSSLNIVIKDGGLVLGTWQGVYFCEFDGPRQRKAHLKIIKSL